MRFRTAILGVLMLSVTGCSSMSPMQVGQMAGTILGAAVAPGVGAPVGSLLGILTGMLVQTQVDKVVAKKERVELAEQLEVHDPESGVTPTEQIALGEPARVWVDETMQEGKMVAGHFEVQPIP